MTARWMGLLINRIVDRPWLTLLLTLLVLVVCAIQLAKLRPSVSYQDMLGKDHPKLVDYEFIQGKYTRDDNLLVLIAAHDGDAFDEATLNAAGELTEQLWQTPFSIRVDSISNYQHSYADGDELIVGDLVSTDDYLTRSAARIRSIAMHEPLLLNRATNPAGNVLATSVSFAFPNKDASEKLEAYGFVMQRVAEFRRKYDGVDLYVSGLVALDATVMAISQRETGLFLVLVIGIVVVLLALFMRSLMPVVLSILVCLFSVMMALSLAGYMGWKLTPFTASVPLVILIIAVADCVHLVSAYLQQRRQTGGEPGPPLKAALTANFRPIAITSITTAIGFLSLNFSESDSVSALGNEVAFGVMAAFAFSVTFLPASLALLPHRVKINRSQPSYFAWSERIAAWVDRFRYTVLAIAAIAVISVGFGSVRNSVNDIIPHYFAESLPWRQANDFAEAEFGGAYTFSWSLQSPSGVSDPLFLADVERFVDWLRANPDVVYVNSVTDTFKRLNRNMNGELEAHYRIPQNRELAAQYLLLYEMSLPFGLDLNNQIDWNKTSVRVQATFKTLSTSQILAMERDVNAWLANNLPRIESTGSGVQLMFAHMLNHDVISLLYGTALGLLLISLCLVFAFRSLQLGLISLAPNLVPALLAFGVWGYSVGQVGMGLAMVSGMTIGIIVDDTVHFLYKYRMARREQQLDSRAAIAETYRRVGPAIVFTTVVLVTGFLAMAVLAEFRVNSDMALMTSMVLLFALLFDLVALPALLLIIDREKRPVVQVATPEPVQSGG